jgi:hypothetical protein
MFVSVAFADESPANVHADHRGTAAMICANVASIIGAATAAGVTRCTYCARSAYVAWLVATLIMMANVASTTHALG